MVKCDHSYWTSVQKAKFRKIAAREIQLTTSEERKDFWGKIIYYA